MMPFFADLRSWIRGRHARHVYERFQPDEDLEIDLGSPEQGAHKGSWGLVDPPGYDFSPLQRWLTPVMKRTQQTDFFEINDLPRFSKDARSLYPAHTPLLRHDLRTFLCQREIAGQLLLGAVFELFSCLCVLSGPLILRQILQKASATGVILLFSVNILGTLFGRSKDQVCRVQSTFIASMLKFGLYNKSLHLSAQSQATFPAGTIINISSHDVAFIRNYFLKVHDIWSAIIQITIIFVIVFWIMGRTCLLAFFSMFVLFASQSKANFLAKKSSLACDTANDERLSYLRDFLYNVKAIKIQSLEERFMQRISECRNRQLLWLGTWLRLTFCFFASINQMIPAITATIAFTAYWWAGHELTADVVFPLLALFDMIYQPAAKLSISITRQFSVLPCFERIMLLLTSEEYPKLMSLEPDNEKDAVIFDNAHIIYPKAGTGLAGSVQESPQDAFVLGPLNLSIPKNKLTLIVGPVGSGKSTLLRAITGQIPTDTHQSLGVRGSLALSEQDPWIRSASARENIVFMRDWDEARYRETVKACCLEEDFANWPAGDKTIIGEKGTNVSGGQRARISMARAVYSEADVILLDDPLAAVDAYVGNQLFYKCIRRLQQTVILVTHQTQFLASADNVISLQGGKVVKSPLSYHNIAQGTPSPSKLCADAARIGGGKETTTNNKNEEEVEEVEIPQYDHDIPVNTEALYEEEERATGTVKDDVYRQYLRNAGGRKFATLLLAIFVGSLAIRVIANYWFVWWLSDAFKLASGMYLLGYVILTLVQAGSLASVGMFSVSGSLSASYTVHAAIMNNLFHAPLSYYESQPIGRILNRLSSDLDAMDCNLMNAVDGLFNAGGQIIASTIMIVVTAPLVLVILLPLSWFAYQIQVLFRVSARELRRVSTILESPVVTVLSESLGAVSTIKAYGLDAEEYFLRIYEDHLNRVSSASIMRDSLDTWVTTRAELLSATIVLSCGTLYISNILPPFQAGLALSTAITFTKNVYLLLWSMIQVEVEMNSVERLQHYMKNIPRELDGIYSTLPSVWPQSGAIEFRDVVFKYRSQKEPALDHINLKVKPGERIGLVGRTGSGKTTLVSTLSRLQEAVSGSVMIDGVDIQQAPLSRLRQSVHVLPQEPLLFEGTLRENLDFRGRLSDRALWDALELCGLKEYFRFGLESPIEFKGANLSAGQTQLLCMARAILQKPKVFIIDEATASVDPQSDRLIQHILQTQFPETTILSVAHRISTLVWMDRIVVMDNGKIVEQGSPRALLEQEGSKGIGESRFRKLIRVDGDKVLEELVSKATR